MKEKEFKNSNSNKLIIGVSILFCAIILIVGATTAYFSQGVGANTDDIVSTDITKTLEYTDNNDYMRGNLIPVVEEDVEMFAMQNSLMNSYVEEDGNVVSGNNVDDFYYIDDDICRYNDEYNACSLYEFTIKNTSEVVQKINATLTPNPNTFKNLYYMIYEEEQEKLTPSSRIIKISTHISETDTSNMFEEVVLTPGQSKTYTVLFYIKSMDYDQTAEDAGKNFGAIVSVNSLTTGYNIMKTYGDACYDVEKINGGKNDGLFKITKFKGISEETGQPIPGCGVSVSEDNEEYYTVVVPSKIGDYNIDIIGSSSFSALRIVEIDGELVETINNRVIKINNVIISEGIKKIEDANEDIGIGAFSFLGFEDSEIHEIKIKFPTSLEYIGTYSFNYSVLQAVTIPKNVEKIGEGAFSVFSEDSVFSEELNLSFEGALDGTSKLRIIGDYAFSTLSNSSLVIPASVEYIGEDAFKGNENLTTLIFMGTQDGTSKLKTIGDYAFKDSAITNLEIPSGVETIGENAFGNIENLTTLIFMGTQDGTSKLQTIGDSAFRDSAITKLELPSSVEIIGNSAFGGCALTTIEIPSSVVMLSGFSSNENLTSITFKKDSEGNSSLKTIGGGAFSNTGLTSITIPSSVTSIEGNAFSDNSSLTSVTFKNGSKLQTIGSFAFYHTGLTSITIPNNVTSIGNSAFYDTGLTSITIPSSVTSIGESAFRENNNLTSVTFESGSELKTIGSFAFLGCNLTYKTNTNPLMLPPSITSFGSNVFSNNSNLYYIYFSGTASNGTAWSGYATVLKELPN